MWFFITKKEIKKIVENFKESFTNLTSQGLNNRVQIEKSKERIARLEGAISVLLSKSQKSPSHVVSKQSQGKIETKLINRLRKSKKSLVMAEISRLNDSMTITEMFESIVNERGLCSKASFYRYLSSLKSQNLVRLRQK